MPENQLDFDTFLVVISIFDGGLYILSDGDAARILCVKIGVGRVLVVDGNALAAG